MRYIDVEWHHEEPDEPIRLVSEIGVDNFEKRKLEFFRNGKIGFATNRKNILDTRLGEGAIPTFKEINSSQEFSGKEISEAEFEALWKEYGYSDS